MAEPARPVRETRTARREREAREARHTKRSLNLGDRGAAFLDAARSHPRVLLALALVVAIVVMLYGPSRNYYVAMRAGQDLQARLEAVTAQNKLLDSDVHRLQSEEGVEDEARKRGLIKEDETSVIVEGLSDDELKALIGEIELEDTRPWYVKVLDVVFFYSEDSWQ